MKAGAASCRRQESQTLLQSGHNGLKPARKSRFPGCDSAVRHNAGCERRHRLGRRPHLATRQKSSRPRKPLRNTSPPAVLSQRIRNPKGAPPEAPNPHLYRLT
jgi:hypothetical protein